MAKSGNLTDAASPARWQLRTRSLELAPPPRVMGIVNVTPDSFSDGGLYFDSGQAIEHGLQLEADGADVLDIGGESTRPGSDPVPPAEELERVIPVIRALARQARVPLSIDTSHALVARAAMDEGAEIINDVTALGGDPEMIEVARQAGAGVCAMHMQGTPQTMQHHPHYEDVVAEIREYLRERRDVLEQQGIPRDRICLDPGIGFGKTHEHNLELLRRIGSFADLGCPVLVGHSRKGFIRKTTGDDSRTQLPGTLAVSLFLASQRVHVLRVHDVRETVQALKMHRALADEPG
jgi:dihydropteroate synthase